MGKISDNRLKLSTFKLNALLDITLAINDNLSTSELIRRYEKLLTDDLDIGKVIVLKFSDKWDCLLNSGYGPRFFQKVNVERRPSIDLESPPPAPSHVGVGAT